MNEPETVTVGELERTVARMEKTLDRLGEEVRTLPDRLSARYVDVEVYNARRQILEERIDTLEETTRGEIRAIEAAIGALKQSMWRVGGLVITIVAAIVSSGVLFHLTRQ